MAAARAAVQTAQINLGYASVTAPISGRIGRALVTEGALVGQGEATPLAMIQQIHPMYVNFTQPAADVLKLRRALAQGRLKRAAGAEGALVRVLLEDGSEHPNPGKLLFSDLSVDPDQRPDHAARGSAQRQRRAAAGPVRAGAAGAGQGRQRGAVAAAGRARARRRATR